MAYLEKSRFNNIISRRKRQTHAYNHTSKILDIRSEDGQTPRVMLKWRVIHQTLWSHPQMYTITKLIYSTQINHASHTQLPWQQRRLPSHTLPPTHWTRNTFTHDTHTQNTQYLQHTTADVPWKQSPIHLHTIPPTHNCTMPRQGRTLPSHTIHTIPSHKPADVPRQKKHNTFNLPHARDIPEPVPVEVNPLLINPLRPDRSIP